MKKHTKKFGLLIVDDDAKQRQLYKEYLSDPQEGHYLLKNTWDSVEECEDAETALQYIKEYVKTNDYHLLVIADAYMPPYCDGNEAFAELFGGLWLIDEVNRDKYLKECVTILLVTYYNDNEHIKPYRNGDINEFQWDENKDYFFLEKPYPQSEVPIQAEALAKWQEEHEKETRDELYSKTFEAILKIIEPKKNELKGQENIIGQSDRMQEVFGAVHSVAPSKANVLLRGESGTGKELIAKAIHYMSPRAKGPFIKFNCASIPEGLLESELFGHEKGAFTGAAKERIGKFEYAKNGTIFLDEAGDMSPSTQAKVLRVLQEKEFERLGSNKPIKIDVRIIAATNKNLQEEIKAGRFREDLYYRLNVVPIFLPPLRERREDIPLLVNHFLDKYNKENLKSISIASDALNALTNYDWPGNVRELENIIERFVVLSSGDKITADDLKQWLSQESIISMVEFKGQCSYKDVEKAHLRYLLEQNNWNVDKVAKTSEVSRANVYNKIKEYGLNNK
ncbi:MAG: sigma-54 dependent transcriptional regulator [Nitrospinae bacterium]|nr:sigma-54 dependent transcriptional regulator [Nitrospinota bacterium]